MIVMLSFSEGVLVVFLSNKIHHIGHSILNASYAKGQVTLVFISSISKDSFIERSLVVLVR